MLLQQNGTLTEAYVKFKELGKLDVIVNHFYEESDFIRGLQNGGFSTQVDELSFLSQNVKSIRFLYFRNRGLLHYKILKGGAAVIKDTLDADLAASEPDTPHIKEFEFAKELFYSMLDSFVNCFVYQEVDESLLHLLYGLYAYLDVRRLARFTLEYAKTFAEECDDIMSVLPFNSWAEPLLKQLLLKDIDPEQQLLLNQKFAFLDPLRQDLYEQYQKKLQLNRLEVQVKSSATWLDVVNSVNAAVKQNQDRAKVQEFSKNALKNFNPYLASEFTLDYVEYVFSTDEDNIVLETNASTVEAEEVKMEETEDVSMIENEEPAPEQTESVELKTENAPELTTSNEKTVQRSLRRLNPGDLAPVLVDNILLIRSYYVETEVFFNQINELLTKSFNTDKPILQDVVEHIIDDVEVRTSPLHIMDFLKALNEWKTSSHTPLLTRNKSKSDKAAKADSDKTKLIEVLTKFGNLISSKGDSAEQILDDVQEYDDVSKVLAAMPRAHITQTKLNLLKHLLTTITTYTWSEALFKAVKEWIAQIEPELLSLFSQKQISPLNVSTLESAIAIYEILIDSYISTKERLDKSIDTGAKNGLTKPAKSNYNSLSIELLRLNDRIGKWTKVFQDKIFELDSAKELVISNPSILIRFLWASNYLTASQSFSWREKKYVVIQLRELSETLKSKNLESALISFPNYPKIGDLSRESLHRRMSTASILAIFTKILDNSDSKDDNASETITLLESILVEETDHMDIDYSESEVELDDSLVKSVIYGRATLNKGSLNSVKKFLDECPIDLRLSLWNILFLYYEKDSFTKFQKGFEQNLKFVVSYLSSDKYKNYNGDRNVVLLNILSFYGNYLRIFLRYLSEHKWQLPLKATDNLPLVIANLSRIFEISYTFSLHEESALYTSAKVSLDTKSSSAFQYFKNFCLESVTILLIYCLEHMQQTCGTDADDMKSKLLILIHHHMGLRRLCDSADGLFLKFSEDILVSLPNQPSKELAQLLSCRFHYKIKLDGQFPIDHYTEKNGDLDKSSAEELAAFILPLCFRKNPLILAPRNDLKQVVDDLFEIIGDPNVETDKVLSSNLAALNNFLEHTLLSARFIKEAFYGLQCTDFAPPQFPNKVAEAGLYYLEAVLMFNFYRVRKKSAQSRTVELERIIGLLKADLIYGSNRVESWILLGQAYGFIVEDDLIWTSDKLNIIDRKVVTANLQRQSLVSYMMAISTMTRNGTISQEHCKPIIGVLMNSFVKEFYSACRPPMDMIAFKVKNGSKFIRKKGQTMFQTVSDQPSVSSKFCLKLMHRCIELAIKSNSEEWSSYFYLAKLKAKLKMKPHKILDTLTTTNRLSKIQSTNADPLLESLYKYCSFIYKYVKADKLSVDDALTYLAKEPAFEITNLDVPMTKDELYEKIVVCLDKLIALDKKAWYHKPSYRQADIDFNFGNYERAKEIMSKYFTLKSSNKTFLQMWKPEHERPGKHFVYMYQYTQFYIKVATQANDLSSLVLLYPKLRRANSTMILLYFAWDKLCSAFCKIIRKIARINDNFVELFLAANGHTVFCGRARIVVDSISPDSNTEAIQPLLSYLNVLTDIRKLNSGYGPTSLIDDTFSAIFLKIYAGYIGKITKEQEANYLNLTPNGKAKRLAKKDILTYTIELATKFKKNTDTFLKDNVGVFNKYVADYEAEEVILQAQRAEEEKRLAHERKLAAERRGWEVQRALSEAKLLEGQRKSARSMLEATLPKQSDYFLGSQQHPIAIPDLTDGKRIPPATVFITNPPKGYGKQRMPEANSPYGYSNFPYGYSPYLQMNNMGHLYGSNYSVGAANSIPYALYPQTYLAFFQSNEQFASQREYNLSTSPSQHPQGASSVQPQPPALRQYPSDLGTQASPARFDQVMPNHSNSAYVEAKQECSIPPSVKKQPIMKNSATTNNEPTNSKDIEPVSNAETKIGLPKPVDSTETDEISTLRTAPTPLETTIEQIEKVVPVIEPANGASSVATIDNAEQGLKAESVHEGVSNPKQEKRAPARRKKSVQQVPENKATASPDVIEVVPSDEEGNQKRKLEEPEKKIEPLTKKTKPEPKVPVRRSRRLGNNT